MPHRYKEVRVLWPLSACIITGLPAVREKSGKIFIFQGQGKVREFCKKSGKIFEYGKVREKSGNFVMNAPYTFYPAALKGSGVLSYPEQAGGQAGGRADKPR